MNNNNASKIMVINLTGEEKKKLKGRVTMKEFCELIDVSAAEVMTHAGKEKQKRNSTAFNNHYVKVNSKGQIFLVHHKDIGAFE